LIPIKREKHRYTTAHPLTELEKPPIFLYNSSVEIIIRQLSYQEKQKDGDK